MTEKAFAAFCTFVLSWVHIHFQIGTGAVFSLGTSRFGNPLVCSFWGHLHASAPELMSALECLKWHRFSEASEATLVAGTEGKGVPRYDGSPSTLQEYAFRVRLRAARDQAMDPNELKKHGPLGLRLIDGLTGAALQVVREVEVSKLAEKDGHELLLRHLYQAFRPRRQQEARELYAAGAQTHGVLSRQSGEPMTSFLLRRRTWYKMLCDLDDKLALPEAILSEQVLMSSGISSDHQLLIRTALAGKMTVNDVCNELIAQHPNIHEKELRHRQDRHDHRFSRSGKGKSKSFHTWSPPSYQDVAALAEDQWEDASQSLGGYEDYDDPASYYTGASEEVDPGYEPPSNDVDYAMESYAALVEEGLDVNNSEAVDYACEVIQLEAEAMFLHNKAQSQGHSGFGGKSAANYWYQNKGKGKGSSGTPDRRRALEDLKKRTTCRRCGQSGHWSTDYSCPKHPGSKKGGKSSSSAMTGTTTTASSGGKKGKGNKPRVVYFSVTEYDEDQEEPYDLEAQTYMAVTNYGSVPPPSSLADGTIVTTPNEMSADQMLDMALQQARMMQQQQTLAIQQEAHQHPVPDDADWEAHELALQDHGDAASVMSISSWTLPSMPGLASPSVSMPSLVGMTIPSSMTGLPSMPSQSGLAPPNMTSPSGSAFLDMPPLPGSQAARVQEMLREDDPNSLNRFMMKPPPQDPTLKQRSCPHANRTRAGSNAYQNVIKCKDCGFVLHLEKKTVGKAMETKEAGACTHSRKNYQGTTATTWKWRCLDCGETASGSKNPGESGARAAEIAPLRVGAVADWFLGDPPSKVIELMQLTLSIQRQTGAVITGDTLDVIYQRCKDTIYVPQYTPSGAMPARPMPSTPPRTSAGYEFYTPTRGSASSAPSTPGDPTLGPREVLPEDLAAWDAEIMNHGQQKGKTFRMIAETEHSYCTYILGQMKGKNLKNPQLLEFGKYLNTRQSLAMMAFSGTQCEDQLLCILDTGCNNTCHGAGWMKNYMKLTGQSYELLPHQGRVRGVGGNVQVVGLRKIPVLFALADGTIASGTITSTELGGSDAPLLLSTKAQRSLGLVIDLDEHTVYSKKMGQYLELVDRDGLPAVRLIPTNDVETDMALRAEHTLELPMSESSSTMSSNETTAHSPTSASSFETSSSNVTSSPNSTSSGTEEAFEIAYDKHKIEEEDTLNYVNLAESPRKVMTRGQRKVMQESMQNVHREDLALWGTLRHEQGLRKPGRLLPFGCKCFLMELFAGAAMVTALAASWGLPVGKPIDVNLDPLHDLLKPANREMIGKYIDDMDPFVLIAGPKCGPWSAWQHINASRSFEMEERIYGERRRWYPVFKWLIDVFKSRLRKGRHIMMEHPWTSAAWTIKCVEDFLHARPYHEETNEPVEVMKIDQCQYGLKDPQNGLPHQKSTGLLLSSHYMKQHLCRRCDHSHDHQQLEGRSRTRVAEQWPQELCHAIVLGAYEELMYGTLHQAFPVEEIFETHEEMGELDAVHSEQDLAPQTKKRRVDPQEIEREELILEQSVHENRTDQLVMAQEDKRRRGWLTLPKEKRLAIRRLRTMTGHEDAHCFSS